MQPTEHVYTMTVNASKGSDAADSRTATRALSLEGTTLNAAWAEGEKVTVYNVTKKADLNGTLKAQTSGASTTLKGSLTGTIENGDQLKLKFLGPNYNTQDGTLNYIATNCDYAEATVTVASVTDGNITTKEDAAAFQNQQAIVKFTLKKKADDSALQIPASTAFTISNGSSEFTVTPTTDTDVLFVALPATSTVNLSTTIDDITYSYNKTGAELVAGKYYEISVKMVRGEINLAKITKSTTLLDGDVLTGTLNVEYHPVQISIADGAKVTLNDVTINGTKSSECHWAGITCNGNATIVLSGTNTVRGFHENYPGIHVPSGKTLTIQGDGSLTASSNGHGAGIGGGTSIDCGNGAACGNITIANTVTKVTATKGGNATNSIGAGGNEGTCGTVTIGGTVYYNGSDYQNDGRSYLTASTCTYPNS